MSNHRHKKPRHDNLRTAIRRIWADAGGMQIASSAVTAVEQGLMQILGSAIQRVRIASKNVRFTQDNARSAINWIANTRGQPKLPEQCEWHLSKYISAEAGKKGAPVSRSSRADMWMAPSRVRKLLKVPAGEFASVLLAAALHEMAFTLLAGPYDQNLKKEGRLTARDLVESLQAAKLPVDLVIGAPPTTMPTPEAAMLLGNGVLPRESLRARRAKKPRHRGSIRGYSAPKRGSRKNARQTASSGRLSKRRMGEAKNDM